MYFVCQSVFGCVAVYVRLLVMQHYTIIKHNKDTDKNPPPHLTHTQTKAETVDLPCFLFRAAVFIHLKSLFAARFKLCKFNFI